MHALLGAGGSAAGLLQGEFSMGGNFPGGNFTLGEIVRVPIRNFQTKPIN